MSFLNAYSKDLRSKALAALDRGAPRREVQHLFGLSHSTIKRWLKRRCLTGDVDVHQIHGRPSVKGEALRGWLEQWVMLWRSWRAFSDKPPPLELGVLLEQVFSGRGLHLYTR